jgi:hypothetical protein
MGYGSTGCNLYSPRTVASQLNCTEVTGSECAGRTLMHVPEL